MFDLVSSFRQVSIDDNTAALTVFCMSTQCFELSIVLQGSSIATPSWLARYLICYYKHDSTLKRTGLRSNRGWICKGIQVVNEVVKGLKHMPSHLDEVIVFDSEPASHLDRSRARSKSLQRTFFISPPPRRNAAPPTPIGYDTLSPEPMLALKLTRSPPSPTCPC